jgi:ADP-ribosyl-[dinitrogen reductase] hydrolase
MKMDNTKLLNRLLAQGKIALEPAPLFNLAPLPLPEDWDFERVEGMLLGLAIGDALGNTTESQLPATRWQLHGEIRDYLPNRYANGHPRGVPSDDSQMAFWTLEQLLEDKVLVPDHLARKFSQDKNFRHRQHRQSISCAATKIRGSPGNNPVSHPPAMAR